MHHFTRYLLIHCHVFLSRIVYYVYSIYVPNKLSISNLFVYGCKYLEFHHNFHDYFTKTKSSKSAELGFHSKSVAVKQITYLERIKQVVFYRSGQIRKLWSEVLRDGDLKTWIIGRGHVFYVSFVFHFCTGFLLYRYLFCTFCVCTCTWYQYNIWSWILYSISMFGVPIKKPKVNCLLLLYVEALKILMAID